MYIRLDEQIKRNSTTRYRISKNTGIPYPTLTKIYEGKTDAISFSILEKICLELNCTPNDILFFGDPDDQA